MGRARVGGTSDGSGARLTDVFVDDAHTVNYENSRLIGPDGGQSRPPVTADHLKDDK